jgi:glutamyl-tRNA synthetase
MACDFEIDINNFKFTHKLMTNKVITRFAPSPTGNLHIGNVRTALINWLYARKHGGNFILRMDDTDLIRSKEEFKKYIIDDLKWLGLEWDLSFNQLSRLEKYELSKQKLISQGRLYPCYETSEEIDIKRKLQLSRGHPPIYDRAALKLSEKQIEDYKKQGRKPHYRFLINDAEISWDDMIKGNIQYRGSNLSDPVVIRADGTMTYMLCSTIDDIEYDISHVIRGEDHVSNTAIQIQMFEAMDCPPPVFGHLSLVKSKEDKISKREGGFEISRLRDVENIEPMAINSFLAFIGSSNIIHTCKNLKEIIDDFDINSYSKSPTTYMPEELELLNHKIVINYEYSEIKKYLKNNNLENIDEEFWLAVRPNLSKLSEIKDWWQICHHPEKVDNLDKELLSIAIKYLPEKITTTTWHEWTKAICQHSGKKGKNLFMPLRLAITGKTSGPELQNLLPLLAHEEILARLESYI